MRAYKTEIKPTKEQKQKIHKTIGTCRFIYNFYLGHNKEIYEKEKRFVSGYDFSKWINNEFIPNNPKYSWIKEVGSKAIKQSIMNADKAFNRFFKKQSKFPRFKKKSKSDVKAYFPKNNKGDWTVERHRMKIPTLGFVRLKEKGYIPTNARVISGSFSMKAGRYYVSVLCDIDKSIKHDSYTEGIGIDLGVKVFAIVSNIDKPFKNINKTKEVKNLEKKLKREQRRLSRKYESLKKQKKKKEGTAAGENIQKQIVKVQKLHQRISNIRENYLNQVVNIIVKQKPSYITIEDLNVRGMMKNRHLSKAIAGQNFHSFRRKLEDKCRLNSIELRLVDRFFPSSKICSRCGSIKKDLKLSDREYICGDCGCVIDRDKNASYNLASAKTYRTSQ
ncbi:RNA-guided endonuclease InsQ/TnpB family protein [Tissierella creatinophila]|uniref:Putative transposase n=1 Tax=Tissierella creatinophila DSM 6911 TaxID=1123403 RepID=A0A1U7M455_TISCR|nr:RNA-guided endonuclease TnpB family protein [Tissierella creatinophila]OLS02097.1 putative transposase [Tissierella creatinophila DSM 6911]